jgi:hypothetical protein
MVRISKETVFGNTHNGFYQNQWLAIFKSSYLLKLTD